MTSPLAGRRIVNTRSVDQAGELDDLLRERGAIPVSYPCIAITPPDDPAELDSALDALLAGEFDWLVLTSTNTVRSLSFRLVALDRRTSETPSWRTAVVGPATRDAAIRELGLEAAVMPETYQASDLAAAIPFEPGQRVLLPQSAIAPADLAHILTAKGATVRVVTAYQTVAGHGGARLANLLARGEVDAVIFASSSAVDGFVTRLGDEGIGIEATNDIPAVCIGQSTAGTARQHGIVSPVVPDEQTLPGVVCALETVFANQPVSKGLIL
jgi:uroporphyrinogen-III synthase